MPQRTQAGCVGRQSLRWINAITNETVNLRFYADGEPPACKIKLDGAPSYINPNPIRVPSDSSGVKERLFFLRMYPFMVKGWNCRSKVKTGIQA